MMSKTELKFEALLLQLREKLISKDIKLWLPPFLITLPNTIEVSKKAFQDLANTISIELSIGNNECLHALKHLQQHALDRLRNREHFHLTGYACLKIMLSGLQRTINIQISLEATTEALQKAVADITDLPPHRWKLISAGKILKNGEKLGEQGVKNCSSLLAVLLIEDKSQLEDKDFLNCKEVEQTKVQLKLLAQRCAAYSDSFFRIEDQKGESVDLPIEEREALIIAMTLHEMGRAAIKKNELALALVMLLEADKEFSSCKSKLITFADNYAVLNLDIAWCYLCLKSMTHLPDAEDRLKLCECSFNNSYGENLERVLAIKGTTGNEAVLFMRLHLLQGIAMFYKNKRDEARKILQKAQRELESLKIDDESISILMELGLSAAEARLGLRATYGSVEGALEYVISKKKQKEQAKKQSNEKKELERQRRKYGCCADGNNVEINKVESLIKIGYGESRAIKALKRSNNDSVVAIRILEGLDFSESPHVFKQNMLEIASKGYPHWMARAALKKHGNNMTLALQELDTTKGSNFTKPTEDEETNDVEEENDEETKEMKEVRETFARLTGGVCENGNDYLDVTLEQEEFFLNEYLSLLE